MAQLTRGRGAATVEMALVLPVLLMLTFGVIEYGWALLKSQQITNAARQAVRVACRPDATNADTMQSAAAAMNAAGLGAVGYTVSLTPGDIAGVESGGLVSVVVNVPYKDVRLLNFPLLPTPTALRASMTMAKEGP